MKFYNKNIFKIIGLSLIFNQFNIYPIYANYNKPTESRYETLEGERIYIEDSKNIEIEEIEIFGNTVQDENNLDIVESVGDLYVDENGDPILDDQNREQYKLKLVINGKNLFNPNDEDNVFGICLNVDGNIVDNNDDFLTTGYIPVDEGEWYYKSGSKDGSYTFFYDSKKNIINKRHAVYNGRIQAPIGACYMRTNTRISSMDTLQIEKSYDATEYTPYKESIIELILPTKLHKIDDIYDRLYWDKNSNRYLIEKNIEAVRLTGNEYWKTNNWGGQVSTIGFESDTFKDKMHEGHSKIIATKFKSVDWSTTNYNKDEEWVIHPYDAGYYHYVGFKILREKLESETVEGFKKWLSINNIDILYRLDTPEILTTNITSKINIPLSNDSTYIYFKNKNNVSGKLKIIIDKLHNISENKVIVAEFNPTIDNISNARMWVNEMEECLLKDQLTERLNDIINMDDLKIIKKYNLQNTDIYIKPENNLSIALSTNNISFEDFSNTSDLEYLNAIDVSVTSTLPYELNASLESEIQNETGDKFIDKSVLNIKSSSDTEYKTFTSLKTPINLLYNQNGIEDGKHSIDIKLSGGSSYEVDVYKTVLKFEVEQK